MPKEKDNSPARAPVEGESGTRTLSGISPRSPRVLTDAPEPDFSLFSAKGRHSSVGSLSAEEEQLTRPVFVANPVPSFDTEAQSRDVVTPTTDDSESEQQRFSAPSISYAPSSTEVRGSALPMTRGALHPLDDALLDTLNEAFSTHSSRDEELSVDDLQTALGIKNRLLAHRLLTVLDQNGDGVVTRAEFLDRVRRLLYGTTTDKLRFAFRIHDLNDDNLIDRSEVLAMIQASLTEEGNLDTAQDPQELTDMILVEADVDRDGYLSYREFEAAVGKYSDILDTITRCEACWIAPNQDILRLEERTSLVRSKINRWLSNRWPVALILSLWISANLALGILAALRYESQGANGLVMLARATGACLNFNGALILIPVMRRLLTKVRSVKALSSLPVDDAVAFHRLVGHTMFAFGLIHAAAHLANYYVARTGIAFGLFETPAGFSGLLLLTVFSLMWVGALPFVRRTRNFELFYFSHILYSAWLVLCLLHGPVFYLWVGVPLLGLGVELLLRQGRRGQSTSITALKALSSGVTELHLARPPNFQHQAGDYAFLQIPSVARHEWHPFTISSAPERSEISMHVRSLGNFTAALRSLAQKRAERGETGPLRAHLDGPYGTASSHIFECENVVMIGAGIGVTPFAAVLESIVLRAGDGRSGPKKVHFFWLNRDAYSFEWFAELLLHLEKIDHRKLVDIHIYMTAGRGHLSSAALNFARAISHRLGKPDLVTGLRSLTRVGRPNWSAELKNIAAEHEGDPVDLFFCGPAGLGHNVEQACMENGVSFRKEHF